jgi:hypothetical protein
MKEGLAFTNRLGCNNVVAESDSMEVIAACTCVEYWWNKSSGVYADCIDLVTSIGSVNF